MPTSEDITFMNDALENVGAWTERAVTVFSFTSADYSGTTEEAGDPATITYGTRAGSARVNRVNLKDVERSGGKYQANDQMFSFRGSFTKDDMIALDTGTYRPVDGPWKFYMGSNLLWQAVCREVQSA